MEFKIAYLHGILGISNWREYPNCSYIEYIWGGMGDMKRRQLIHHEKFQLILSAAQERQYSVVISLIVETEMVIKNEKFEEMNRL